MGKNIVNLKIDGTSYSTRPYGTCTTASGTAAKAVTCADFSLVTGATILVKFTYANSVSSPTLNVNNTGAKPIYYRGAALGSSLYYWGANDTVEFYYNGTQWDLMDVGNTNSTYANYSFGNGYATCATEEATTAKVVTYQYYSLATGGIVAVKFTYAVPANSTLNINSKGAKSIYYNNAAITAGVIGAGDIATFVYDGTNYVLLAVDNVMTASEKTKLSGIASGAQVNQNAFSNVKAGSNTIAADGPTDTVEFAANDPISISGDATNDKVTISHGKKGPSSNYTSGNTTTSISGSGESGTIKIPQLTVDTYGHVTAAADENVTITMPTIPTIPSSLKNPKALKFGSKTYDGSAEAEITAADLGLSSALKYHGTTTTAISDGSTTNPIVIGGSNHTATQGCVVAYGKKEFVWTGSAWEELGNEGNYKVVQTAVTDPTASGSTTAFIDTISQDTNGKITVTKKNVNFPSLASYVTNPEASTANHVAVFTDATGKVIGDSGYTIAKSVPSNAVFTDTNTKVTSADNHYTPTENTGAAISASGGSATNITGTSGKLNVVTGLKRDAKGHIVGVTSANIYSTDNNTDTNYYPTAFTWTSGAAAGPTGSLTGTGMSAVSFGAIPSASASTSGVVTTGAQTFAGSKTFTDNITILAENADKFINFKYTSTDLDSYSWRIGYLGTGQGDNNALAFQTNKTGAWVDALKFTLPGDATFSQSVTATKFVTSGGADTQVVLGNGSLKSITDINTKVTSATNHYTPSANTASELSVDASSTTAATWNSTSIVTGVNLQRDAKGHVVGVTVDSVKMPANPNSDTKNTTGSSDTSSKIFLVGATT